MNKLTVESQNRCRKTNNIHPLTVVAYLWPSRLISIESKFNIVGEVRNRGRCSFTIFIIGCLREGSEIESNME